MFKQIDARTIDFRSMFSARFLKKYFPGDFGIFGRVPIPIFHPHPPESPPPGVPMPREAPITHGGTVYRDNP